MRYIVVAVLIIAGTLECSAQYSAIQFGNGSFPDAIEQAAELDRPLLLYFGKEDCGSCVQVEQRIFTDLSIARAVNDKFVPVRIQPNSSAWEEMCDWYSIETFPAFVVVDKDEVIRHKFVGNLSTEGFVQHLTLGLDEKGCLEECRRRFDEGERDPQFLKTFISRMRDSGDLTAELVRDYLSRIDYREFSKPENIQFIFNYSIYNLRPTLTMDDRAFEFMVRNRELFARYYDPQQVRTRIVLTAYTAAMEAAETQNYAKQQRALALLRVFDDGEGYELLDKDGVVKGRIAPKQLALSAEINYYYHGFLADQAQMR